MPHGQWRGREWTGPWCEKQANTHQAPTAKCNHGATESDQLLFVTASAGRKSCLREHTGGGGHPASQGQAKFTAMEMEVVHQSCIENLTSYENNVGSQENIVGSQEKINGFKKNIIGSQENFIGSQSGEHR